MKNNWRRSIDRVLYRLISRETKAGHRRIEWDRRMLCNWYHPDRYPRITPCGTNGHERYVAEVRPRVYLRWRYPQWVEIDGQAGQQLFHSIGDALQAIYEWESAQGIEH